MTTPDTHNGTLFLIPVTLGEQPPLEVLPLSVKRVIGETDHYIVENQKSARRFIKKICPDKVQADLHLYPLNKRTDPGELPGFLQPCLEGRNMGVISEAGCPGIADPGADVVALAHRKGIRVEPLVGPSSILLALMASGMNGQSFAFNGYLPIDKGQRKQEIRKLEKRSAELNQSQIFIETPYRNNQMLADLASTLQDNTLVCVACDITLPTQYIRTQKALHWKKNREDLHKRPCIFIIHAGR
ncbi:SAM-dependent methyltransferase [Sinomicrobium soli]|uniref:SAM-dependent methyltransferase n=1 Tax=Sinomicrobium sp. N-1-3-6 TaxID=2219864 RepID=UPI000DCB1D46|nr:SAM-dependent methyltransferase [Sinomicrobium sp. N-1-3-6]RAV29980.1 SAM-dependent methyltransferase [Sinomicrobium sp. N-1-3-6]